MLSIRRIGAALAGLLMVLAGCSPAGEQTPSGKTLRIGVDLPLTGPEMRAAVPTLNGIRYYVGTHPTIAGFAISLAVKDDAAGGPADPSRGVADAQAFLSDPNVVAMIGPLDGAVARLQIPTANAAGLAMISPATSNPCLTRDLYMPALLSPERTPITCKSIGLPAASELRPAHNNNFFRLTTTDELQGAAAADYAFDTLHILRAAAISDHELYGQGLAGAFVARFTRRGGTVAGRLDTDPAASAPISDFLRRMKTAGAQAVYYGGVADGCAIRSQMASVFPVGNATPFLGADGIAEDPDCLHAAGQNAAGILATVPIVDSSSRTEAAATIRSFKAVYPKAVDFGPYTMPAYDATAILYAALERAISADGGSLPSRSAVVEELAKTSGFEGTTGRLGFDPAGDTTNRVISIYAAPGSNLKAAWPLAGTVDYSARLPY
jgi:branched-chain amino acid transport system substrate-binding protein